jgi:cytochrome P450
MSTTARSAATSSNIPFLNIIDPEFDFRGPEMIAAQNGNWYAESPIGLLVLRYTEAQALLRDQRMNHDGESYLATNGVVDGPIFDWFVAMIVNHDGEHHRRLRGLVNKAFTPRMVNNLRPFIRSTAERLVDQVAKADECNFVDDFADPLPLAVLSELLGVPPADHSTFRRWTTDIGLVFSLAHGGDIRARVEAAVTGLYGYVNGLIAEKRVKPGNDLISALVAAQRDDGQVNEEELRNLVVTLVFAAHDTTRHQLSNAMVAFAQHPEQWTLLAQQPDLIGKAVEEVIRWCPSTGSVYRFATEDFEYRGLHLKTGTMVTVLVVPTQRDPHVFPDGHLFDITATRQAAPIQFGAGPHHCLGAALARAELGEALPALTERLGPPIIAGPVAWHPPLGIHGPTTLPLRFGA